MDGIRPMVTLRELYVAELNDLFAVEQRIARELPVMAAAATSSDLRDAFDAHYRETWIHIDRLAALFAAHDERPRNVASRGIDGIIDEAHARHQLWDRGEVLDAALICSAQHIEHYEIAGYMCARSYALALGDTGAARVLRETLEEENRMSRRVADVVEGGSRRKELPTAGAVGS